MTNTTTYYYANSDTAVEKGDFVEYTSMRFWRGWQKGQVTYVPGVSKLHPEMEHGGIAEIGVAGANGTFRGIYIDPDTGYVRATVRFLSRGDPQNMPSPQDIKPEEW